MSAAATAAIAVLRAGAGAGARALACRHSATPTLGGCFSAFSKRETRNPVRFFCASPSSLDAQVEISSAAAADAASTAGSGAAAAAGARDDAEVLLDSLDMRVGLILKAWVHPEADSLYVEEVDVGEAEPRTICSGLVPYIPLHLIQGARVIVLANLKPRNMRGVKSNGMLLAASDASHENVELLLAPEDSVLGERIWFGSEEDKENQLAAVSPNQVQKKKIWEMVQPRLKTDASCVAAFGERPMRTSAGVVVCTSLKNAKIS